MTLICCPLNQNVPNLYMSKELQNTGLGIFHQARIMVDGSQDGTFNSGSHFLKS